MTLRHISVVFLAALIFGCNPKTEVSKIKADSKEFERLPKIMRDFPAWRPVTEVVYDFETRDGARRPSGTMRYETKLSEEDIVNLFSAEAKLLGCLQHRSREHLIEFSCTQDRAGRLELHLQPAETSAGVIVLFIQTTPEFETTSF